MITIAFFYTEAELYCESQALNQHEKFSQSENPSVCFTSNKTGLKINIFAKKPGLKELL